MGEKSSPAERCVRFLGHLTARLPLGGEEGALPALLEQLLLRLAHALSALDKAVRCRAVHALSAILWALPAGASVSEDVVDQLVTALLDRLSDKAPAVRAQAAHAVCKLIVPDEGGGCADHAVVLALQELIQVEKNKDVRLAVVAALPLLPELLPLLLERMGDVSAAVRCAVVSRMERGVPTKMLSIRQRVQLLRQALRDREPQVAKAGAELAARWLRADCGGHPLRLLELLDVETHPGVGHLVLDSLAATGALDAAALVKQATAGGGGLAAASVAGVLLCPAEALLWCCLCKRLHGDASSRGSAAAASSGAAAAVAAAAAADQHEVLEAALPASAADMMALVAVHAAAGPRGRFAATQLLEVAAACMDWTDGASREAALPVLLQLMAADPLAEQAGGDGGDWDGPQLAGNGGDGRYEEAVVTLLAAVQGAPGDLLAAGLGAVGGIASSLSAWLGGEAGGDEHSIQGCQWLQALTYASLLLRRLPSRRAARAPGAASALQPLWGRLLLPGVRHAHGGVRAKAAQCLALYALSGPPGSVEMASAVLVLRAMLVGGGGTPWERVAAAQGLVDLALEFGLGALDALLRDAAVASGAVAVASADGRAEGALGAAASAALRDLVALLMEALAAALDGGAGGKRPGRRARPAADRQLPAPQAELVAVVAEGLAKLLLARGAWRNGARASGAAAGAEVEVAFPDAQAQSALATLLLLQFHPATEEVPAARQCLSVFLQAYASGGSEQQRQLAGAFRPALRRSLLLPGQKGAAPLLAKYLLQLLQLAPPAAAGGRGAGGGSAGAAAGTGAAGGWCGREVVVLHALQEAQEVWDKALSVGRQLSLYKPYVAALLKVALALTPELAGAPPGQLQVLLQLVAQLARCLGDATLAKDACVLQQQLADVAAPQAAGVAALSECEVDEVVRRLEAMVLGGGGAGGSEAGDDSSCGAFVELPALPQAAAGRGPAAAAGRQARGGGRGRGRGRRGSPSPSPSSASSSPAPRPRRHEAAAADASGNSSGDEAVAAVPGGRRPLGLSNARVAGAPQGAKASERRGGNMPPGGPDAVGAFARRGRRRAVAPASYAENVSSGGEA